MSHTVENVDLIDFQVSGLPIPPTTHQEHHQEDDFESLIDTELPVLEHKLQNAPNSLNSAATSRRSSVDVEDILIAIDDYEDRDVFFDLCANVTDSNGNAEALLVLKNLDDILNATLLESEKDITQSDAIENNENAEENGNETLEDKIEDCLLDLDNYLKAIDSSCDDSFSESNCSDLPEECSKENTRESSKSQSFSEGMDTVSDNLDEEELRNKLQQIEVNYAKFLASGCVNRAYVDTENITDTESTPDTNNCRPLSACAVAASGAEKRKHPVRASTVSVIRRVRPKLSRTPCRKSMEHGKRKDFDCCTLGEKDVSAVQPRTSGTAEDDDVIDWTWVQELQQDAAAHELTLERRAHASGDCCTGTVVVEPQQKTTAMDSNVGTSSAVEATAKHDEPSGSSTWLRNSMRRLQRLRLPIAAVTTPTTNDTIINPQSTSTRLDNSPRPLSAPSRLPLSNTERSETARATGSGTTDPNRPNTGRNLTVTTSISGRTSTGRASRSTSRDSRVSREPNGRARSSSASSRSRPVRSLSSSVTSLASSDDSSPSSIPAVISAQSGQEGNQGAVNGRSCDRSSRPSSEMPPADSPLGHWPHSLSSMLACLGCTLGLFNICRFSVLTVHFGANFIFQFVLLSMVFGLPLFTLQLCLGQQLGAGVIDMWKISPLFQGVGVSLLIAQGLMGLYSIIGVSWMFVFFRDSFITKADRYRWAEPFFYYRPVIQAPINGTYKLSETIPDYFNGIVLQRYHLPTGNAYGTIKFQLAFNLVVVWMIIFVSLSKGLRSYGKVIYVFVLFPVFGTFILCAKVLGMMPPEFVSIVFPETSWDEFFVNSKSWLAAAQETFLTWGLLGAAVMQIASHNKHKHLLQRDSSLIAVITFTILILMAFLANTCVQILKSYGYTYVPNSFERMSSYQFLRSSKDSLPPSLSNLPVRYMVHNSFILGEKVVRPGVDFTVESGYQVLRLATELVPATFAVVGSDQVSPFWAVLFYFILIMFGICQQLAIWHCVITGIMAIKAKVLKSWETTITFFSCACGFVLGLPMATELGIYVVYFMDYVMGGIWWLSIIILLQIIAVFMVRGRPYSGDTIVTALFRSNMHTCVLSWAPALLSFTWNVILPVALMALCISTFKNGNFKEMFIWHHAPIAEYWPLWSRQIGSMLQLLPVLCIPFVAVIQSYRYLNNGPNDILEDYEPDPGHYRIQLLYRPPIGEHMEEPPVLDTVTTAPANAAANLPSEDPPPKYTPPPSYTTATGARLAKFLRQSIRRSVRRLANVLGETSAGSSSRQRPAVPTEPPPPDYETVIVEMNASTPSRVVRISTLERLRNLEASPTALSAADVASILRNSFRRSTLRSPAHNVTNVNYNDQSVASLSAENLVDSAAPIGETSLVLDQLPSSRDSDVSELKAESNVSVI